MNLRRLRSSLFTDPLAYLLLVVGLVVLVADLSADKAETGSGSHPAARQSSLTRSTSASSRCLPSKAQSAALDSDAIFVVALDGATAAADETCSDLAARFNAPVVLLPPQTTPDSVLQQTDHGRLPSHAITAGLADRYGIQDLASAQLIIVTDRDIYLSGRGAGNVSGGFADTSTFGEGSRIRSSSIISTAHLGAPGSADARTRLSLFAEVLIDRYRYGLVESRAASTDLVGPIYELSQLDGITKSACDYQAEVARIAPMRVAELGCERSA
jgi:hypothetical protein